MKIIKSFIGGLPTLYFLLTLVGFDLVASILMPPPSPDAYLGLESYEELTAVTQVYTIPYRAFSLLVMIGVMVYCKERVRPVYTVGLFTAYYILWLIRMTYDLFIRTDIPVNLGSRNIIFIILGFFSIFVTKRAFIHIELGKVFKLIVILQAVCVLGMLIRNPLFVLAADEIAGRTKGSVGLNTISTANLAMSLIMMIVFWFVDKTYKLKMKMKILLSLILTISLVVGLRASSRGPIVSFVIVLAFYSFCISKYKQVGIFLIVIFLLFLLLFKDQLLNVIGSISPVLRDRFMEEGGSALERQEMARDAIRNTMNYPVLGYAYGVLFQGTIGYPHNTVLEAFNGLGLVGGILYLILIYHAVKASYELLHARDENAWVCLLFMVRLVESMFSGNFYNNEQLCMLWVFVFLYYNHWEKQKLIMKYERN